VSCCAEISDIQTVKGGWKSFDMHPNSCNIVNFNVTVNSDCAMKVYNALSAYMQVESMVSMTKSH
jgi:hypothetical protein